MHRNKWVLGLIGGIALALSLVATRAALADSPHCNSMTQPAVGTDVNPCNNEVIPFSGTETATLCQFVDGSGGVHVDLSGEADATGVGSFGNTYKLTATVTLVQSNLNAQGDGEASALITEHFVSEGSAPNFTIRCPVHVTVSGGVPTSFQKDGTCEADCTG